MAKYNTLLVESSCTCCYERITLKIQFQYGEVWDYLYYLNDSIRWGNEKNTGVPGRRKVVVDGVAEACDHCDEMVDYLIFLENDVIKSIRQNTGEYQFFNVDSFEVLEV